MRTAVLIAALLAAAAFADTVTAPELEPCGSDSHCFAVCERQLGRPCTDEDVFGPALPEDDETTTMPAIGCRREQCDA